MPQDQETTLLLARRCDDPPTADFRLQRRHPLETFWRNKFEELAERDAALSSILAHVETTAATTQIELQEKLTSILNSLSQLNHMSNRVDHLQQEIDKKREGYNEIRVNEMRLEELIRNLEEKIGSLESANQYLRHKHTLFNVNLVALIILAAIMFYHVFFG